MKNGKAFLDGNQTGRQGCLNNTEDLHDQISGWLTLEFPLSTNDSTSGQRFRLLGNGLLCGKKDWGFQWTCLPLVNIILNCKSSCCQE